MVIIRWLVIVVFICCLSSCMDGPTIYAPVSDVSTIDKIPKTGSHRVLPGETLYSIAWRYGLDTRYLAQRNHLFRPYHVYAGQVIYLQGHTAWSPPETVIADAEPAAAVDQWQWPAQGDVVGNFSGLNKGINIDGEAGDPIYAAAAGRVVYSGSGLRGYGNLIIIEHNDLFMTAYAHNTDVVVKEGDRVKSGQKIAEMGKTGAQRVMLHFEIRRSGQPVDPLTYLSER